MCSYSWRWLLLPLLLLLQATNSLSQNVSTDFNDAAWRLSQSKFACQLQNALPGYGELTILAEAGGIESVSLNPDPFKRYLRTIDITAQHTPWTHDAKSLKIGRQTMPVNSPFYLSVNASHIVEQLQKGLQLVVDIERTGEERVVIKSPAFKFGETAAQFYSCFSKLLVLNFDQAKKNVFYFPFSKQFLDPDDQERVKNIAAYMLADTSIERVEIDAHTDSLGSDLDNRELSRKRAEKIARLMKSEGVSESKILQRFHGERYPVANNNTQEGRNKNRRVKIKLIRR